MERRELYSLFQAQEIHPILDLHVLSQIVNRFGDKLCQPKSIFKDKINFYYICTCRCSWSSPPISSLVRGLLSSYETRNSEPSRLSDRACLSEGVMNDCVARADRSSDVSVASLSVTTASSSGHRQFQVSIDITYKSKLRTWIQGAHKEVRR